MANRITSASDKPDPGRRISKNPLYLLGVEEGKKQRNEELLTFLEKMYMDPELATDSAEAMAILEVTRKLAIHTRSLDGDSRENDGTPDQL